ncbi:Hypothetical predicted protein [Podarcis lilfordi]|uniref:Uncharacterized protein n=1 Tax=Podarcis lilfordi TaxID=74358 RepID=A0AA35L3I3_9SAUR|nr:Hypothetical predicted protein [Podarcis lilfordi]
MALSSERGVYKVELKAELLNIFISSSQASQSLQNVQTPYGSRVVLSLPNMWTHYLVTKQLFLIQQIVAECPTHKTLYTNGVCTGWGLLATPANPTPVAKMDLRLQMSLVSGILLQGTSKDSKAR